MARTFTGLKLQGEIGRFGKTELSDIEGYVELPDGKVLSGCESGKQPHIDTIKSKGQFIS